MIRVTIVIAVGEARPDFAQVACFDRLVAHHADGPLAWRPPVHQYESHVAPPTAVQNTALDLWKTFEITDSLLAPKR